MSRLVAATELAELEARVQSALETGDDSALEILGYGEISLVLGWPAEAPVVACKRLPVFADAGRAASYGALVQEYVDRLRQLGVDVVPTEWHTVPSAGGGVAAYVVQPVLPADSLAARLLAADPGRTAEVMGAVLDVVAAAVSPGVGLDAQISNWAWVDGALRYYDVTTPMLNDAAGRTRMDLALLTSPLPAVTRPAVRRFLAPGIVADYHDRRKVVVDLVGNLLKERLEPILPAAIAAANEHVTPPLSREEIDGWYRGNARTWELMLRLRRADRWWQRRVRRRAYAYLLPGPIER